MLIEVVFGAAIVLVVLSAVLLSMDVSAGNTRIHRNRGIGSDLAQQDQERMRALPVTALSNYRLTRTLTVSGSTFTVVSRTDWVRDASGTVGCTADATKAEYLALSSTVTWPDMGKQPPVVLRGLLTPTAGVYGPDQGSLAVQLVDRAGQPVVGANVAATGPDADTDTTDVSGCVVFGNVAVGAYTLTATTDDDRVDVAGSSMLTTSGSVLSGATQLLTLAYDHPATATVSFDTKTGASFVPAQASAVTVTASGLPAPGTRTFVPPTVPASSATITSLYPFTGGYAVYAGDCPTADPRNAPTSNATYFATNPGQIVTSPAGTPSVTVHVPAINVVVRNAANAILTNARVRVTASGAGCGTFPIQLTNSSGALPAPAFPFGAYSLCADDGNKRRATATVSNTSASGTAVTTLKLSSTQTSNCP